MALAVLVNRAGTMVLPFLVLYLTRQLGFDAGRAGLVVSLFGLVALATSPVAGRLCDRFSHQNVMRGSLLCTGAVLFAFPLARSWPAVLVATAAFSAANEGFRPASLAVLADLVPAEKLKAAYALNRLAVNLGMSIGPAVGGFLVATSFRSLFWLDGATSILAAIILMTFTLGKPAPTREAGARSRVAPARAGTPAYRDRRLLYFLVSMLPVGIVFFQHVGSMPLYLVRDLHFRESVFGLLITVNTVLIVFLEVEINASTAHWPHRRPLALGAILTAVGFGAMGFARGIGTVALAVVVWTFGEMTLLPAMSAYVAAVAPPERRGEYMGMFTMTFGAAFTIGPWLGTELLERAGPRPLWAVMFVLGALSAVLMGRVTEAPRGPS